MRNTLADVVAAGMRVLDAQGLEGCSMRRVAAELGVQPSALYHHVPDKQTLLALVAEARGAGVTAMATTGVTAALSHLRDTWSGPAPRILICGSLYLAGEVLADNGTPPA